MYLDRIRRLSYRTRLVARNDLARRQWELALAGIDAPGGKSAWLSRPLLSRQEWLAQCWRKARDIHPADADRSLLTPGQTDSLWRKVIAESREGDELIEVRRLAALSRNARRCLLDHDRSPGKADGAGWQPDFRAFLRWNRQFERHLDLNGWVDPDSLPMSLNRLPAAMADHDLVWLDRDRTEPAIESLESAWRAAGFRIESIEADDANAKLTAQIVGTEYDEISLAAAWAAERLAAHPGGRFAVVVPDLQARRFEIETVFGDILGQHHVWLPFGSSLPDIGLFGAALTALRLLGPDSGFAELSRWLRSPFFSSRDADRSRAAAQLELELRQDPCLDGGFARAWQHFGLRKRFRDCLPDCAAQIDAAFNRLPRRASPTAWTAAWQDCLRLLGWQGFSLTVAEPHQLAWDQLWAALSEQTPVTGAMPQREALVLLLETAAATSVYQPPGLTGVQILDRIDDIGPGFSGTWVTGASADKLPQHANANPLLPWILQHQLSVPEAHPAEWLRLAQAAIDRLTRRVAELVFSCPERIDDQLQTPSPLINGWTMRPGSRNGATASAAGLAHTIGAGTLEIVADTDPPFDGKSIPGGTRTLDLQAQCPVKAFCAARLKAEPLRRPARGIDARIRGLLLHRALELIFDPDADAAANTRIPTAIAAASAEWLVRGDAAWTAHVHAEQRRAERLIRHLLDTEAARVPFAVDAVERRVDVEIAGRRLRCRIDRIDRLATGEVLIIDYKTGQSAGARWFDDRLAATQLPVYALDRQASGIAVLRLAGDTVEYRVAGLESLGMPGQRRKYTADEWQSQLDLWHDAVAALIEEFCAGDTRISAASVDHLNSDSPEHAGGAWAAVSRTGDMP